MTTAISHPREAFPIAPEAGRIPHSTEQPADSSTRPWILKWARVPDAQQATIVPETVWDDDLQVSRTLDGELIAVMANTHSPTIPDGNTQNPPPLDEGTKD